ncbi:3-galactosyl-N-acetylglucosaminide 4-alpha-L-fucosyltransferase FUT3-like [Rhinophrynus dorsalis]
MKLHKLLQKQNWPFTCLVLFLLFFYGWISRQFSLSVNQICQNNQDPSQLYLQSKEKTHQLLILVWTWPFGEIFPLDTCKSIYGISGCNLTADRRLYEQADAVIIHHREVMYDKNILPIRPRPLHQRWVWFNLEPPLIVKNLNMMDNLVNMTMTYRQDSDIFIPYGWMKILKEPQMINIPTKTKLVAWVVSKWYPGTLRIQYYEKLKKHIQIDVYGKKHQKLSWDDFHSTIGQYKFYLAFENSNHKDYITEKLWENSFGTGTVPIVLGPPRENYEHFIPSNSFIHVDDFSSPQELAAFLLELDKDNERYQQYFSWRSSYEVVREIGWDNHYCKACKALHQSRGFQVIPNVAKWFL